MVEENNGTFESLSLDSDESEHMALIPENIQARLHLANDGANITLLVPEIVLALVAETPPV